MIVGFQLGINLPSLDRPTMDWSFLGQLGRGVGSAADRLLGSGPVAKRGAETGYEREAGRLRARREYGAPLGGGGSGRAAKPVDYSYVDEFGRITQEPMPGVKYDGDGADSEDSSDNDGPISVRTGATPDPRWSRENAEWDRLHPESGGPISLSPFASNPTARLVSDYGAPAVPGLPDADTEAARRNAAASAREGSMRGIRVPTTQARQASEDMRQERERLEKTRQGAYDIRRQAPLDANTLANGESERAARLFETEDKATKNDAAALERARKRNEAIGSLASDRIDASGYQFGEPIVGAAPQARPLFDGAIVPGSADLSVMEHAADPYRDLSDDALTDYTKSKREVRDKALDVKTAGEKAFAETRGRNEAARLFPVKDAEDYAPRAAALLDAVEKGGVDVTALRGLDPADVVKNSHSLLVRAMESPKGDKVPALDALYRIATKAADDDLEALAQRTGAIKVAGSYQVDPSQQAAWDAGMRGVKTKRSQAARIYKALMDHSGMSAPAGGGAAAKGSAFADALREAADELAR